jgi:hypothetical protein
MLRALSLCACCCHYPGAATGCPALLIQPSRISLPRYGGRVGLRIDLFEVCSAFTRVTACTLALSPYVVTCFTRRLQPFRCLHSCSGCFRLEHFAGWGFHPLESAAFSRRTPSTAVDLLAEAISGTTARLCHLPGTPLRRSSSDRPSRHEATADAGPLWPIHRPSHSGSICP